MATKLKLKKRRSENMAVLSLDQFRSIFKLPELEAKDRLYNLFKNLLDEDNPSVHDKHWLEQIVNFVPLDNQNKPKRIPFTEQAKWLKLAARVAELEIDKEGDFTLSDYQETIIWERLNSAEFAIQGMPLAFVSFILDFLDATGRRFADMEPEKSEPEDKMLDGPALSQDEPTA